MKWKYNEAKANFLKSSKINKLLTTLKIKKRNYLTHQYQKLKRNITGECTDTKMIIREYCK